MARHEKSLGSFRRSALYRRPMRDGFVRIASFPEPIEAHLAKTKVESEGIEAYLTNENTIRMDIFYSQALGGVGLYVPEEQAEKAVAALAERIPLADVEKESDTEDQPIRADGDVCPKCHSPNVYADRRPRKPTIFFFFFGLPLWFFRRQKKCANCGWSWR